MYSGMKYCTLEDFEMLINGKNPLNKERVLTFLNHCKFNLHSFYHSKLGYNKVDFKIYCRHGRSYISASELFDNYEDDVKKYDESKNIWKYSSKFLINWILENTFVKLPKVMVDCFKGDSEILEKYKISSNNDSYNNIPIDINTETFEIELLNSEYEGIDRPEMILTKIVGDEAETILNRKANNNRELIRRLFNKGKISISDNGISREKLQAIKRFLTKNSFGDKKKMGHYINKIKTEDFFEITSSSIKLKTRIFIQNIV